MWTRFFVEFRQFLMLFFGSFITYLVTFSLYLAITMRNKNLKKLNRRRKNIITFDKSG